MLIIEGPQVSLFRPLVDRLPASPTDLRRDGDFHQPPGPLLLEKTQERLVDLDARADKLASQYLQMQLAEQKSAYTLPKIRSALRLFFINRQLANSVNLPPRKRTKITRSRGPAKHDVHFQPAN